MARLTSIIIVNFNTLKLLKECIASIRKYTRAGIYEIIVVDNGSHDGSAEWLKLHGDIRLIANAENMGFPVGCNQGMKIALGTELLLLNSDTVVTKFWLDNMLRALYSKPCIGAVGCVTNSCVNWQNISVGYTDLEGMQQFAMQFNKSDHNKWHPWFMLVGYCLLFKQSVFECIGTLDERFSPGNYEDDDYCLRMRLAGYELLLLKDTFIHHYGSASFLPQNEMEAKTNRKKFEALNIRNEQRFCEKWNIAARYGYHIQTGEISILSQVVPANARLLLVDVKFSNDLYFIAAERPDLQLVATTSIKLAAEAMKTSFLILYAQNDEEALTITDNDFDVAALMNARTEISQSLLDKCHEKVDYRKGTVYCTNGKHLFPI